VRGPAFFEHISPPGAWVGGDCKGVVNTLCPWKRYGSKYGNKLGMCGPGGDGLSFVQTGMAGGLLDRPQGCGLAPLLRELLLTLVASPAHLISRCAKHHRHVTDSLLRLHTGFAGKVTEPKQFGTMSVTLHVLRNRL
jgi:hypothetical protein